MQILVFGAGAIGSYLGFRLAGAGHDVALVGRQTYVRAVRKQGLCLRAEGRAIADDGRRDATAVRVVHPQAVESIEELPAGRRSWDLVLLTVKAYDTTSAAQALAPHLGAQTPLLIVQNGVGSEALVREVLQGPGCVRLETTRGGLNLAVVSEALPVQPWAELFRAAGLRTSAFPDYRALKWSKLLLNIQANAIPAILDMTPGAVFADPTLFAVERAAFKEAVAVMRALGLQAVNFPNYPVRLLVLAMELLPAPVLRPILTRLVASGRGDKRPSLLIDLASGQPQSEVLYLNGAVAKHGQQAGVPVPVNRCLCDALMGIVAGGEEWGTLRGCPDRLLAMLEASRR